MRPRSETLPRFTRAERWVHRTTALLVLVLTVTAGGLYYEPLALLFSRRPLVETTHVVAGLLLPAPTLLGLLVSPALRADIRVLNRLTPIDRAWLRRRDRRGAGRKVGKFNAGQKLAAAVMGGAFLVLLGTGLLLLAPVRIDLPVGIRQGATIVHDAFTFGLLALLAGHIWMAWRHPEARLAMRSGSVDRRYAERRHGAWAAETSEDGVTRTGLAR